MGMASWRGWVRSGLLLIYGLLIGGVAGAVQWDSDVDGRAVLPEQLTQRPIRQAVAPQIVATDDGWWLLGDPGVSERRLIARFPSDSIDVAAATVVADGFGPEAAALADGGLAITLNKVNDCFFTKSSCSPLALLEVRNSDTTLRWSRAFQGPCSTAVEQGADIVLACAGVLHRLDGDGYTLAQHRLGSAAGDRSPRLVALSGADGLLLLEYPSDAQSVLRRFDADLRQRWRLDWDLELSLIDVSDTAAYLSFSEVGADEAVARVYGVALDSAALTIEAEFAGWIRAAAVSADVVVAIVAQREQSDEVRLINADRDRGVRRAAPGETFFDVLGLASGFVLASSNNGRTELATTFISGVALGFHFIDQPRSQLKLARVGARRYALVSRPSAVNAEPTLRLFNDNGDELSSLLTSVQVKAGAGGGVVDAENRTAWVGGGVSLVLGDYMARTAFDGSPPLTAFGEFTSDYRSRWLLGPSRVGSSYCIARAPAPVIPQPFNSGITDLLCTSRTGDGVNRLSVTLPGRWPFGIGLGASTDGMPKILSSVIELDPGYTLYTTVLGFDGSAQTSTGSVVPDVYSSDLGPDLSGLLGISVVDSAAMELYRVEAPQFGPRLSWRLSDGGWLLSTIPEVPGPLRVTSVNRVGAQGQHLWRYDQALDPVPLPRVVAAEHGPRVVVEFNDQSDSARSRFGATGQRLRFDRATGARIGAPDVIKDTADDPLLLSLDPAQGEAGLWRLLAVGSGILVEGLDRALGSYWLPCSMTECRIDAHDTGSDGVTLLKLSGNTSAGFSNRLVSIALDSLPLAAGNPGDPERSGRWHDADSTYGGMVVTREPAGRRVLRYWLGEGGTDAAGVVQPRWWKLQEGQAVGSAVEYAIEVPGPTATLGAERSPLLATLRPLINAELYLSQNFDRTIFSEFNGLRDSLSHHRLQQRATSAQTQTFINAPEQWIAVDQVGGEGVWARPDGRWYRLRRQSGERWVVSLEVESGAGRGVLQRPQQSLDLALGQLRISSCGLAQWQLLRPLTQGERRFADAYASQIYRSGDSCAASAGSKIAR